MIEDLAKTLADLKESEAIEAVQKRLESNDDPIKILSEARQGMEIVGQRFADGDYFLPELVYSGELLKDITDLVKPKLLMGALYCFHFLAASYATCTNL